MSIFLLIIVFGFIIYTLDKMITQRIIRRKAIEMLHVGDKIYTCSFTTGNYKTGHIIPESIHSIEITSFIRYGLFKHIQTINTLEHSFQIKDYMQGNYSFWRAQDIDCFLKVYDKDIALKNSSISDLQIIKDGVNIVSDYAAARDDEEIVKRCEEIVQRVDLQLKSPSPLKW